MVRNSDRPYVAVVHVERLTPPKYYEMSSALKCAIDQITDRTKIENNRTEQKLTPLPPVFRYIYGVSTEIRANSKC